MRECGRNELVLIGVVNQSELETTRQTEQDRAGAAADDDDVMAEMATEDNSSGT